VVARSDAAIRQGEATDLWGYFQAHSLKRNMYEIAAEQPGVDVGKLRAKAQEHADEEATLQTKARAKEAEVAFQVALSESAMERHSRPMSFTSDRNCINFHHSPSALALGGISGLPCRWHCRWSDLRWVILTLAYKKDRSSEAAMTPTPRLAFITIVTTLVYLGLAILGWGGFAAFFSHPPFIALAIVLLVLSGVALFSEGNLSPGEHEDRANRWVLAAFAPIGLLMAYLPAYTDRQEFWTLDGDAIRWLGVVLFTGGGAYSAKSARRQK
jgi:hypothetical protein